MTTTPGQDPVLNVRELSKSFVTQRDLLGRPSSSFSALKAVNLALFKGETVALVGESGSGKSTLARCMLRLVQPSSGSVYFGDINVLTASRQQLRDFRRQVADRVPGSLRVTRSANEDRNEHRGGDATSRAHVRSDADALH